MRIGGLGISEATKWGETPEIQRAANKTAQNAMTDGFVGQIKEMAKKDAQKGVYMSDEFGQMRLAQMRKYVSPTVPSQLHKPLPTFRKRRIGMVRFWHGCLGDIP